LNRLHSLSEVNFASLALLRHLSVSHPHKPSLYSKGRDPLTFFSKNTSHKLLCPTAFPDLGTLLCTSPFEEASKWLPSHLEGPYPGFGYPLYELKIPKPSRASLSSERSGASPFRAFFLLGDRSNRFQSNLSAPALLDKTSQPHPGAPAVSSHRKSCAPLAPQMVNPGQGHCSLGTWGPPRLSPDPKPLKGLLHLQGPLSLLEPKSLSAHGSPSLRGFGLPSVGVSLYGLRPA